LLHHLQHLLLLLLLRNNNNSNRQTHKDEQELAPLLFFKYCLLFLPDFQPDLNFCCCFFFFFFFFFFGYPILSVAVLVVLLFLLLVVVVVLFVLFLFSSIFLVFVFGFLGLFACASALNQGIISAVISAHQKCTIGFRWSKEWSGIIIVFLVLRLNQQRSVLLRRFERRRFRLAALLLRKSEVRSGASSLYLFLLCFELPSLLRASSSSSSPVKFSLYLALQDQRLGFFRVTIL
jgi:signal transduction histidine kinase